MPNKLETLLCIQFCVHNQIEVAPVLITQHAMKT